MTAEWGTLTFPESGSVGNVQAVGHGFRTGPTLPRDHGNDRHWEYNIDLKSGLLLAGPGHPNAGIVAGIDDVWNELHRCFNCNFPIGSAPHDFPKVGDHIPLSVGMGSNGPNMPFPVEVTQISKTANDINEDFPMNLTAPLEREGYTGVAYITWQPYIDNLTRHIAEARGIPLMDVKEMGSGGR